MENCHVSLKSHGSTGQMCSSLLKFLAQIDKIEIAESASKDIAKQRVIQLFQLWETFIQGLFKEAIKGVFNNVSSHINKQGICISLFRMPSYIILLFHEIHKPVKTNLNCYPKERS